MMPIISNNVNTLGGIFQLAPNVYKIVVNSIKKQFYKSALRLSVEGKEQQDDGNDSTVDLFKCDEDADADTAATADGASSDQSDHPPTAHQKRKCLCLLLRSSFQMIR